MAVGVAAAERMRASNAARFFMLMLYLPGRFFHLNPAVRLEKASNDKRLNAERSEWAFVPGQLVGERKLTCLVDPVRRTFPPEVAALLFL